MCTAIYICGKKIIKEKNKNPYFFLFFSARHTSSISLPLTLELQCLRFMKRRIAIEDQLLRTFFGEEWSLWRKNVPSGLPTIP
jgi:protein-S-isoprenylcysteine O-methyltransferase Ste14